MAKRNRPDQDGTHLGQYEKNKKKIYATQSVCRVAHYVSLYSINHLMCAIWHTRTISSAGQSSRLITEWSQVRVLHGPLK